MPTFTRAVGVAVAALVVVVGAGTLFYVNSNRVGGAGAAAPTTAPTPAPTASPTPESSYVAPGITGWTPYTSEVHGFTMGYPEDWLAYAPATRQWQAGDRVAQGDVAYADVFVSPVPDELGVWVWEMPAGAGADIASFEGLKTWATSFCSDAIRLGCDAFTQSAVPMCLDASGDACRSAILVPSVEEQFAFIPVWTSKTLSNGPDRVIVVEVGRDEDFPGTARYGGSVELLKSILSTMDVTSTGRS